MTLASVQRRENADLQQTRFLRSEEHTSELQSPCNLVCHLLLEKKIFATAVDCNPAASGIEGKDKRCGPQCASQRRRFFFFDLSGPHQHLPSAPPGRSSI